MVGAFYIVVANRRQPKICRIQYDGMSFQCLFPFLLHYDAVSLCRSFVSTELESRLYYGGP